MRLTNNERFEGASGSFKGSDYVSHYKKSTGTTYLSKKTKTTNTEAQAQQRQCFAAANREKWRLLKLPDDNIEKEEWIIRWEAEKTNKPDFDKDLGTFIMTTLMQLYKSGEVGMPNINLPQIDTTEMDAAIIARANQRAQGQ
ncbi:MAG: hypothetical protein MJ069_04810 [Salinivirgaceae bacterium]|nr:hypothetical protein [Salinivirgaceae bacterium]